MDRDRPNNRMVDYENGENGFKVIQDQPPAYSPFTSKISKPEVHTFMMKPKDFLGWSIFNLMCCCIPLGIAAVVFSVKSRSAAEYNDYRQAKEHGKMARNCNLAGIIIGTTILVLGAVLIYWAETEMFKLIEQLPETMPDKNGMYLGTDSNGMQSN